MLHCLLHIDMEIRLLLYFYYLYLCIILCSLVQRARAFVTPGIGGLQVSRVFCLAVEESLRGGARTSKCGSLSDKNLYSILLLS